MTARRAWRGGRRRAAAGFTLVEILVALAVVGILAAVVLPSYTDHVQRSKLTEAFGALSTYRVQLEQYYQDNRNYGSTASACGVTPPSNSYFTLTCSWGATSTSQTFVATATGQSGAGLDGFVFTVNESDDRRTVLFAGSSDTATCWKRRRSDSC